MRIAGEINGKIEIPFCVFKNRDRNYPIVGVPDNVPGVRYRTQPKGWMDRALFPEYFSTSAVITALPENRTRTIYVDNCISHDSSIALETVLEAVRTRLHRFPRNCTHLIQPLDQIVLRSFKALFRKTWSQNRA